MAKAAALPTPTGRELEILKILWEQGPTSVRGVHELLPPGREEDLAYNTVQTLLRLMEDKALVSHHVEGRTFIYTPRFTREESASRFLRHVFDGAAPDLVMTLLKAERIPAADLDRMRKMIDDERGKRNK